MSNELTREDFPCYAYINYKQWYIYEAGRTYSELTERYEEKYGEGYSCDHMELVRISEYDYQEFLKRDSPFYNISDYWYYGKRHNIFEE